MYLFFWFSDHNAQRYLQIYLQQPNFPKLANGTYLMAGSKALLWFGKSPSTYPVAIMEVADTFRQNKTIIVFKGVMSSGAQNLVWKPV